MPGKITNTAGIVPIPAVLPLKEKEGGGGGSLSKECYHSFLIDCYKIVTITKEEPHKVGEKAGVQD